MPKHPLQQLIAAVVVLVVIILTGIIGLMLLEHWPLLDAAWVTIISLTTTGYGDILPQTPVGRIFLMSLLFLGVGAVAYAVGAIISYLLEFQLSRVLGKRDMKEQAAKLKDHIIICGAGRVGKNVIQVLVGDGIPFVAIEQDEATVDSLRAQGHIVLMGNASKEEVLLEAGLMKARGVISTLPEDAFNVFVALTARHLRPDITVVSRCENPETVDKLKKAGADKVIVPALLGGQHMANAVLKPISVELVETLFTNSNVQMQLEELSIKANSQFANRTIKEALAAESWNIMVVAVIRDGNFLLNPRPEEVIRENDVLIILGSRPDLTRLERIAS